MATWASEAVNDAWLDSNLGTVDSILNYLRSSLPTNLTTDPTDAQLMAWYSGDEEGDALINWMAEGWDSCTSQPNASDALISFCSTYGSAGSSDINGPGVSYPCALPHLLTLEPRINDILPTLGIYIVSCRSCSLYCLGLHHFV